MPSQPRPTFMQNIRGMSLLNNRRMILSVALFIASMNVMANIFGKPDSELGSAGIQLNVIEKRRARHAPNGNPGKKQHLNSALTADELSGSDGDIDGCSSGLLCDAPLPDEWMPWAQRPIQHPRPRHLTLAGGESSPLARTLAPFLERRTDLNDLSDGNSRRSPDDYVPYLPGGPIGRGIIDRPRVLLPKPGMVKTPKGPIFFQLPDGLGGTPRLGLPGRPGIGTQAPNAVPLPDAVYPMGLMLGLMLSYAYRCRALGKENTTSSL